MIHVLSLSGTSTVCRVLVFFKIRRNFLKVLARIQNSCFGTSFSWAFLFFNTLLESIFSFLSQFTRQLYFNTEINYKYGKFKFVFGQDGSVTWLNGDAPLAFCRWFLYCCSCGARRQWQTFLETICVPLEDYWGSRILRMTWLCSGASSTSVFVIFSFGEGLRTCLACPSTSDTIRFLRCFPFCCLFSESLYKLAKRERAFGGGPLAVLEEFIFSTESSSVLEVFRRPACWYAVISVWLHWHRQCMYSMNKKNDTHACSIRVAGTLHMVINECLEIKRTRYYSFTRPHTYLVGSMYYNFVSF